MAQAHTIREEEYTFHEYPATPAETIRTTLLNRVVWGAVFAGVAMMFVVQLVLNLIGVGVGLTTLEAVTGASAYQFTWGAAIWLVVTGIISAFIGGFTAGRLAGEPKVSTSGWHGLIAWATAVLAVVLLMTSAAGAMLSMGGAFQTVMDAQAGGGLMGGAAEGGAGAAAQQGQGGPGGAQGALSAAMEPGSLAAAALSTAAALIFGALAAWFGGCAGTVPLVSRDEKIREE